MGGAFALRCGEGGSPRSWTRVGPAVLPLTPPAAPLTASEALANAAEVACAHGSALTRLRVGVAAGGADVSGCHVCGGRCLPACAASGVCGLVW